MNRLLMTGAALSVVLGTTGAALAQNAPPTSYYPSYAPAYGQQMPPQQAVVPQQADTWQGAPMTDPHSAGTGGRAYYRGQKTN